ncbi:MAG: glycosyltransferase family 4 protein [Bacteroidales bacterium]|nr:glycosyltransferase family 4 protein [Bacteroidales bacterium]
MLINLTNHPLHKWDKAQQRLAEEIFGEIVDIQFPNISPDADEKHIEQLADKYLNKILSFKPDAVHIQGEFTFTFRMVSLLKQRGIKCIASITERLMNENPDGSRTYQFRFVRFREYS